MAAIPSPYQCGRIYTTTPTIVVGSKLYIDPRMRPQDIAPSSSYSDYYQYYTVTGTAGIVSSISNCPASSGFPQTFTWYGQPYYNGTYFFVNIVYPTVNVRVKVFGGTVAGTYVAANYQIRAATPGTSSPTIYVPTVGANQTVYSYGIASYIGAINDRYSINVYLEGSGEPTGAYISVETY
jgi:hypothetical protein